MDLFLSFRGRSGKSNVLYRGIEKGPKPEISVEFFYCFEFSISRKCLGFFYFRTKFENLAWVLLVNLSKTLTWFLLVNLTKNAQKFPALRAESVGVLLLFEISPKKYGVLLFEGGFSMQKRTQTDTFQQNWICVLPKTLYCRAILDALYSSGSGAPHQST